MLLVFWRLTCSLDLFYLGEKSPICRRSASWSRSRAPFLLCLLVLGLKVHFQSSLDSHKCWMHRTNCSTSGTNLKPAPIAASCLSLPRLEGRHRWCSILHSRGVPGIRAVVVPGTGRQIGERYTVRNGQGRVFHRGHVQVGGRQPVGDPACPRPRSSPGDGRLVGRYVAFGDVGETQARRAGSRWCERWS